MIQQQVLQLIFWLGVIFCLPTFYRFSYAGSTLLWRKLFPTRIVEIQYLDERNNITRKITVTLDRSRSKSIAQLIREAEDE